MSQLDSTPPPRQTQSEDGIYVVLVTVAFLALAVAVGVVWYKNVQITGESNPFAIIENVEGR